MKIDSRFLFPAGILAFFWTAAILLSGCDAPAEGESDPRENPPAAGSESAPKPLRVVCTTGQVADIVRNVGGAHVQVESLMGSGVDPHSYQATPGDVRKLNRADLVLFSGLHLEGRLAEMLERMSTGGKAAAVTDVLVEKHADKLRKPPEFEGMYDPHVWFDPHLWSECVEHVGEILARRDPPHAADYRQNAAAYRDRINALTAEIRRQLASIPDNSRVLVTAHDAFGYFGKAFDLEVHGLQGISTLDEADLGTINQIVKLLADRKIKAIFVESSVPERNVHSVIQGCAAQGHQVVVGGELYSDAMGEEGTYEGTYVGMLEHNVKTIVQALK